MKGIEILSQIPIKDRGTMSWVFITLGIAIAVISLIVFLIYNRNREKDKGAPIVVFFYLVAVCMIFFGGSYTVETGRYQYECTFDDTVTANDVAENFDIISVENGIWILEDKEK